MTKSEIRNWILLCAGNLAARDGRDVNNWLSSCTDGLSKLEFLEHSLLDVRAQRDNLQCEVKRLKDQLESAEGAASARYAMDKRILSNLRYIRKYLHGPTSLMIATTTKQAAMLSDYQERMKQISRRLHRMASNPLTGVWNREECAAILAEEVEK